MTIRLLLFLGDFPIARREPHVGDRDQQQRQDERAQDAADDDDAEARRGPEPGSSASASGMLPAMTEKLVMMIGRKRVKRALA